MSETYQQRNMRMGWGCKCHGETFCPDLICIDLVDDVPVYVRKDSPRGQAMVRKQKDNADV